MVFLWLFFRLCRMSFPKVFCDEKKKSKIAIPSSRAEFVYVSALKYLFAMNDLDFSKVIQTTKDHLLQFKDHSNTQQSFLSMEKFLIELCKADIFEQIEQYRHLFQNSSSTDIEIEDTDANDNFLVTCSYDRSQVIVNKEKNTARKLLLSVLSDFKQTGSIFGILQYLFIETVNDEGELRKEITDMFTILNEASEEFEKFYKENIIKTSFTSVNPFFNRSNTKKLIKKLRPSFEQKLSLLLNKIVSTGGIDEIAGSTDSAKDKNTYIFAVIRNLIHYLGLIYMQPYKPGEALEKIAIQAQNTIGLYDSFLLFQMPFKGLSQKASSLIHSQITLDKLSWDCSIKVIILHFALLAFSDFFDSTSYRPSLVKLDDILLHINRKSKIFTEKEDLDLDSVEVTYI